MNIDNKFNLQINQKALQETFCTSTDFNYRVKKKEPFVFFSWWIVPPPPFKYGRNQYSQFFVTFEIKTVDFLSTPLNILSLGINFVGFFEGKIQTHFCNITRLSYLAVVQSYR